MLLQLGQRNVGLVFHLPAQQAMLLLRERRRTASAVCERGNRARLSLLAKHLFDEGLADVELFGNLNNRAFAFIVGGNDALPQI